MTETYRNKRSALCACFIIGCSKRTWMERVESLKNPRRNPPPFGVGSSVVRSMWAVTPMWRAPCCTAVSSSCGVATTVTLPGGGASRAGTLAGARATPCTHMPVSGMSQVRGVTPVTVTLDGKAGYHFRGLLPVCCTVKWPMGHFDAAGCMPTGCVCTRNTGASGRLPVPGHVVL